METPCWIGVVIKQFLYCSGGRLLRWPDRGFYEAQQSNKVSNHSFNAKDQALGNTVSKLRQYTLISIIDH